MDFLKLTVCKSLFEIKLAQFSIQIYNLDARDLMEVPYYVAPKNNQLF